MADNYKYLSSTGTIVPDTSEILLESQEAFKAAFGADLVVTPDTPQGTLITVQTLARTETVQNNAALANQINPNIAGGPFLDAIMALTGVQRESASKTLVFGVMLTGVPSTVIPAGTQAATEDGDLFATTANAVIGMGGFVLVDFASVEFGPVPCPANELNQVVTSILGWETVNNSNTGILGANQQSDIGARALRDNTLGFQGVGLTVAIISALYAVEGVQSLWFQENIEATTQSINGISMVEHSIYVCVNGGTDLDVAAALLENKSSGSNWNGTQTVSVVEPASNQAYNVKFSRPTPIAILVRVSTKNGDSDFIKAAIMDYANGLISGEAGFVVGGDVSPFELAGAISIQYPTSFITKVEISLASSVSYSTDVLAIAVNEIATITPSNISVVVV